MASLTATIKALLTKNESTTLDFKQTQYPFATATDEQKSEIIKDILSFANTSRDQDAYILIGITEGHPSQITGITHHLSDADLQQLISSKTNRPVEFSYRAPRQLQPHAAALSTIRNHLEHKYLKAHEPDWPIAKGDPLRDDTFAYNVDRRDLEQKPCASPSSRAPHSSTSSSQSHRRALPSGTTRHQEHHRPPTRPLQRQVEGPPKRATSPRPGCTADALPET